MANLSAGQGKERAVPFGGGHVGNTTTDPLEKFRKRREEAFEDVKNAIGNAFKAFDYLIGKLAVEYRCRGCNNMLPKCRVFDYDGCNIIFPRGRGAYSGKSEEVWEFRDALQAVLNLRDLLYAEQLLEYDMEDSQEEEGAEEEEEEEGDPVIRKLTTTLQQLLKDEIRDEKPLHYFYKRSKHQHGEKLALKNAVLCLLKHRPILGEKLGPLLEGDDLDVETLDVEVGSARKDIENFEDIIELKDDIDFLFLRLQWEAHSLLDQLLPCSCP